MEIARKFLVKELPENPDRFETTLIEQGYLCTSPVVRVRRDGDDYVLTYKGKGMMAREEVNLPLTEDAYAVLIKKCDGALITKRRTRIPYGPYTIELDRFLGRYEGLVIAEVEFPSEEEAKRFTPPDWFSEDVTFDVRYHNSYLSKLP